LASPWTSIGESMDLNWRVHGPQLASLWTLVGSEKNEPARLDNR